MSGERNITGGGVSTPSLAAPLYPATLPLLIWTPAASRVPDCTVGDDVQPGQMAISGQKPS